MEQLGLRFDALEARRLRDEGEERALSAQEVLACQFDAPLQLPLTPGA